MILSDLLRNLSILAALSLLSGFITQRWKTGLFGQIMQGVIFGSASVIGMLNPVNIEPGVIFDGRGVVTGLSGLFFGPVAAGISSAMGMTWRLYQGGQGSLVGAVMIGAAALLGTAFFRMRIKRDWELTVLRLFSFGLLLSFAMVFLLLFLPVEIVSETMRLLAVPILISYPPATVLIGKILWDQESLYKSVEALRHREEQFRATLYSIGDAVITTDTSGRVRRMNPVAERLTGWTEADAFMQPVAQVFRIINEISREKADNPVDLVLREGKVVGLANHTWLIARDGAERPIADSGAPIKNGEKDITGVVLVFRDQTAEYAAQKALRDSEILNRSLIQHLPQRVFIKDVNSVYVTCNERYAQDLGQNGLDIIGRDDFAFYPRELAEAYQADDRAVIQSGMVRDFEERYLIRGEERWAHTIKVPYRDGQGRVIGVVGVFEDITEHKQAEDALKEREEQFRALFECSRNAIITISPPSWKIIMANPAARTLFGVENIEDFIFLDPIVLSPEDQPGGRTSAEKALYEIEKALNEGFNFFEWTHKKLGGEEFLTTVSLVRIELAGKTMLQATVQDITKRRRAEEALRASEEKFRLIAESSAEDIWQINREGRLIYASPAAKKVFGYTPEEALGMELSSFFVESERERAHEIFLRALNGEEFQLLEFLGLKKDGTTAPLEYSVTPIRRGDEIVGVQGIARDITIRKRAEEALRASEAKMRGVFQAAPMGIGLLLSNRVFVDLNSRLCEMTGYSKEELVGKKTRILYPTYEDYRHVGEMHRTQIAEKGVGNMESRFRCKDGRIINVLLRAAPLDPADLYAGLIFTALDITAAKKNEEELQKAQAFLAAAIEQTPAGILIADAPDVNIRIVNSAALEMCNKRAASQTCDIPGNIQRSWQVLYPDGTPYKPQDLPITKAVVSGAVSKNIEAVIRDADGQDRLVLVNASPVRNSGGQIIAGVVVFTEIGELRKAEREKEESENRYRDLFDNSTELIYTHDLMGNYTSVNKTAAKVLGYSIDEALGINFKDIVDPSEFEKVMENTRKMVKGEVSGMGPYEVLVRAKDGRRLWLEVNTRVMMKDGKAVGVHGSARDITARKLAEEERIRLEKARQNLEMRIKRRTTELAESEKKFRLIADSIEDVFWLMDIKIKKYLYISTAFDTVWGCDRNLFYNSPERFRESVHPEDRHLLLKSAYLADSKPRVVEYRIIRPDGSIRWILDRIFPITEEDGSITMLAGVCRDVTENRFMQKQLLQNERLATLGTLSASIAHEINNPNSFIIFNLPILKEYVERLISVTDQNAPYPNDEEDWCGMDYTEFRNDALGIFSNIEYGASRIRAIVADLQEFSRYKEKIERVCTDLNDIIANSVKMCRPRLNRMVKNLYLDAPEVLPRVFTDPQLIQQVLMNLIINAAQAADKEDSWVRIKAEVSRAEPGHVAIEVADNGCGMDERTLQKVFDPFFTTKAEKGGTGLGLSICRNLVEALGGRITVNSEPGRGSTFRLLIPTAQLEGASCVAIDS